MSGYWRGLETAFVDVYKHLCSNQINTHPLIGQLAMVYCTSELVKKSRVFRNFYIKAIDQKLLWFIGMINYLGGPLQEFVNHLPTARDLRIFLVLYQHPNWFISIKHKNVWSLISSTTNKNMNSMIIKTRQCKILVFYRRRMSHDHIQGTKRKQGNERSRDQ